FQAEDGIRDATVTGVQTCALPILADASGHQHERCVEDRDGVWDRKAVRRQKGGEEEDGLVRESQGRDEQEQDRDTLSWGRRMDGVIERFVRTSENRSLFFHHILNGGTIAGRSEVWVEPTSRSTVPEEKGRGTTRQR